MLGQARIAPDGCILHGNRVFEGPLAAGFLNFAQRTAQSKKESSTFLLKKKLYEMYATPRLSRKRKRLQAAWKTLFGVGGRQSHRVMLLAIGTSAQGRRLSMS